MPHNLRHLGMIEDFGVYAVRDDARDTADTMLVYNLSKQLQALISALLTKAQELSLVGHRLRHFEVFNPQWHIADLLPLRSEVGPAGWG